MAYEDHERVRVTTADSAVILFENPRVVGDSLMGFSDPECRSSVAAGGRFVCSQPEAEARVLLDEIVGLEISVRDPGRSIFLGLGLAAAVGWVVYKVIAPSIERDCYLLCS